MFEQWAKSSEGKWCLAGDEQTVRKVTMAYEAGAKSGEYTRICLHCHGKYRVRAGRGLCRKCWDHPEIRAEYPKLPFGGERSLYRTWQKEKLDAKAANEDY